ncbi:MAG TPA: ElyC/SanA/YdcF family protein [Candidatus Paceibacterota bacterium]|jgi:SanA protein|nr:ElyC/SanA/YdcF family protein [Candidatus Paceibacterota bacterium]
MYRYVRIGLVIVLIAALVMLLIPITMRILVTPYLYSTDTSLPQAEAAVVLGASVEGNEPSPILAERANAAIKLYEDGKVSKILVTGDNATTNYDEVNPVQHYLLAAGIPPQDIFLDHAGFDTYSSMYRAKDVFDATSVVVVTQDFHLPRAVFTARSLGLTAYGYNAGAASAWDYVREIPASAKAVWDLLTRRVPEYLGTPYPLSGDGQATWY